MRDEAQVFMVVQFAVCNNELLVNNAQILHKDFILIPYPSGYCRQYSYRAMAAAVAALWA